jgi:hypothetical protein
VGTACNERVGRTATVKLLKGQTTFETRVAPAGTADEIAMQTIDLPAWV